MALNRALVYVTAAESARVGFSPALVFGCIALLCYLIGLSYAAKQENLREPRGFWPLAFMVLPFANVSALASPAKLAFYALFRRLGRLQISFLLSKAQAQHQACGRLFDRGHLAARRHARRGSRSIRSCPSVRRRFSAYAVSAALRTGET